MDHDDGEAVPALQIAQKGEQRRDFATDVLIDAVQPHERVEDQQTRLQVPDRVIETGPIGMQGRATASGR